MSDMSWKSTVRRLSGSLYVTLPKDYLRAKGIVQEDVAIFELRRDGLLVKFRKPVSPSQEKELQ